MSSGGAAQRRVRITARLLHSAMWLQGPFVRTPGLSATSAGRPQTLVSCAHCGTVRTARTKGK